MCAYIFAISILKEKPVPKYDVPAVIFLVASCATIVVLSSKDEIHYTYAKTVELLTRAIAYTMYAMYAVLGTGTYFFNLWYRKKLRGFEKDLAKWTIHQI